MHCHSIGQLNFVQLFKRIFGNTFPIKKNVQCPFLTRYADNTPHIAVIHTFPFG